MLYRLLGRVVEVERDEVPALLLSCAYFFCILSAYYIIRPIRDEMGVAGGVRNLPWLFTGTLVVMLLANPPFAALVAKLRRRTFVSLTYRFFMVNLLLFFVLLKMLPDSADVWVGRAFFVWTSVFNLFVVSIFWAFMADVFRSEQGRRLFGFIAVGGTLGAIAGAGLTAALAERLGPAQLMLFSVVLLEIGVQCVLRLGGLEAVKTATAGRGSRPESAVRPESSPAGLERAGARGDGEAPEADRPIGGSVLAGITHVARSPYLLGICAYMLLYTITATVLYFQQAEIVDATFADSGARTSFFASIDLAVNVLTIVTQVFLTGRIIKWLGVGVTLTLLPAICVLGFSGLGLLPTVGMLVVFQVARRAGNYAVARPTRELLYTVVSREDKYKAKSFIDTFVYRGGDQIGAWSYALLGWLGLSMVAIAFVTVPVAALWLLVGFWLGRGQESRARDQEAREEMLPVGASAVS